MGLKKQCYHFQNALLFLPAPPNTMLKLRRTFLKTFLYDSVMAIAPKSLLCSVVEHLN